MLIKRLKVKELHGLYDYDVTFNDDLTFIFGENGCGKTTILNIVSSIVTGKLYNLFGYSFKEISLQYCKNASGPYNTIKIMSDGNSYDLSLNETTLNERIDDIEQAKDLYTRAEDAISADRNFFIKYNFARFLKNEFNYIFLPLSRNSQDGFDYSDSMIYRRRRSYYYYYDRDFINKNYLNDSLRYVEEIVRTGCIKVSSAENKIDAKFRKNILTSSLKISSTYDLSGLLSSIRNPKTQTGIEKNKAEYIKTLTALGEINEDTNENIDSFFKKYQAALEEARGDKDSRHSPLTIEFLLMDVEFNRIKEIAAQAQKIEAEKEQVRMPITSFLETVNGFLNIGTEKKKVKIKEGKIVIEAEMPHREISLYDLSSGEKQIVIIFACLAFGLSAEQSGIYIIDEPEASLHLAWQKKFVESIKKVNSSIQLIFATHAPEIIGRYSSSAVRLKKMVSPSVVYEEVNDD